MEENEKQEIVKEISDEVVKEVKRNMSKNKSFGNLFGLFKDIVTLVLVALIFIFGMKLYDGFKKNTTILDVEGHDLTLNNNGLLGFTVADFSDVIVGTATKKALLIVTEQELSVVSTITKAGLFELGVFSKNQSVTYYGTGQYTVDLSNLSIDNITLDNANYTVTVTVPHPTLHEVIINTSKTVFGDTEKGLLAFGDIKLTTEENNKIMDEAHNKLMTRGLEKDCMNKADELTKYVVRDLFEVAIADISKMYKINIEFIN